MTIALYLAGPALACAFSALIVLSDRAALKRRRAAEEAESAARQARIVQLRAERRDRERRHARRSEIDREIRLLTARSLQP